MVNNSSWCHHDIAIVQDNMNFVTPLFAEIEFYFTAGCFQARMIQDPSNDEWKKIIIICVFLNYDGYRRWRPWTCIDICFMNSSQHKLSESSKVTLIDSITLQCTAFFILCACLFTCCNHFIFKFLFVKSSLLRYSSFWFNSFEEKTWQREKNRSC